MSKRRFKIGDKFRFNKKVLLETGGRTFVKTLVIVRLCGYDNSCYLLKEIESGVDGFHINEKKLAEAGVVRKRSRRLII